jgi:hypothetical protein
MEKLMFCLKKLNKKVLKRVVPCLLVFSLLVVANVFYFSIVTNELLRLTQGRSLYLVTLLVIQAVLFLNVLNTYLLTVLMDPGRFDKVKLDDNVKVSYSKIVQLKQVNVKTKWCSVSAEDRSIVASRTLHVIQLSRFFFCC